MKTTKIRIDRILSIILITILSSTILMFGIKMIFGSEIQKPSEVTYIIKESASLEAERVIVTSLLNDQLNFDNISESKQQAYNDEKEKLTAIASSSNLDELKTARKNFELVVYDIKETNRLLAENKTNFKVENGIHYINDIMIINKEYALPSTYHPNENPEAKNAFLNLLSKMQGEELAVDNKYIGYRDFEVQKQLYADVFNKKGEKQADLEIERAGHSEHQSGLGFTVLNKQGQALTVKDDAQAVDWLNNNAYLFGFIIRYPQGKESITGNTYHASQLRYVGEEIAKAIHDQGISLEEYLGLSTSQYRG